MEHPRSKYPSQIFLVEQVVLILLNPTALFSVNTAGRNNHVNVRVEIQPTGMGVEHRRHSCLGPKPLVVGHEGFERTGSTVKQQGKYSGLMLKSQSPELFG